MERTIEVWGKPERVSVHQSSKTVWVATGDYMGRTITTKGRSANSALTAWKDAARYAGN